MNPARRTAALLAALLPLATAACQRGADAGGPEVEVGVLGVFEDLGGLLVVAQETQGSIRARLRPSAAPVAPETLQVALRPWSGGEPRPLVVWDAGPASATAVFDATRLAEGLWTALVRVEDTRGHAGFGQRTFVVRRRREPAPIGPGQSIWLDFEADVEGGPARDFSGDLQAFGLGSPRAPGISAQIELRVIEGVVSRVREAYLRREDTDTGWPEPVAVEFASAPLFSDAFMRLCIGGADPEGRGAVGSVDLDPGNAHRDEVLCGREAGVFPRGLLAYADESAFRESFDPLLPERSGVPAGEHPLDAVVLARGFALERASVPERIRWFVLERAITRFIQALATVVAHEVGHSLGLVPPGPPPAGLGGGFDGDAFSHAPDEPMSLMSSGSAFHFATLAGLERGRPPRFRAVDWAYLRDQLIVLPGAVAQPAPPALLAPPGWHRAPGG